MTLFNYPLAFLVFLSTSLPLTVAAQVIPDGTMGTENSRVRRATVRGREADLIEGGATRGRNLFHSFQEFGVREGDAAYFANPVNIENIFGRVTGNNPSNILGTLGVDGTANLFLMNPNGILFGPNSSLDVGGSFAATTANAIGFGELGFFSANDGLAPGLLTVNPSAFFFNQVVSQGGTIASTGNLTAGQDLTLSGNTLDLQGRLTAGRDLTLEARDTLRIRDSVTTPFVAAANGQMLVQGDRVVDIFALNHPNSGFVSGGDMTLRSANQVGGDAHYWSGGNFRIEQLDGSLGDLYSPYDPIIRSFGDVSFDNYLGASLHILAGGSIDIGTVVITGPETGTLGTDFIQQIVKLSNGIEISVDGSARPTLDIRAGVNPSSVDGSEITGIDGDAFLNDLFAPEIPTLASTPTSANITIDNVAVAPSDGLIFITNQYETNPSLRGDITINGNVSLNRRFDTSTQLGNGGSIIIDSRNNIALTDSAVINACSDSSCFTSGRGGDIRLIAEENVGLGSFVSILTNGGGNIQAQSNRLLMEQFSQIVTPLIGAENGGDIQIQASEAVRSNGGSIYTFAVTPQASGRSGNIVIETGELILIGAITSNDRFPEGFRLGGDITTDVAGESDAGDITINAKQVRLLNGAQIRASAQRLGGISGSGDAGNIIIRASELVEVTGIILETDDPSKIETTVGQGTSGDGGDLLIETNRMIISNGAQIQAGAFGAGQGGSLTVNATEAIEIFDEVTDDNSTGFFTGPEGLDGTGRGGNLTVRTGQLSLLSADSQISNEVDENASGDAGDTLIEVDRLIVGNGARITVGSLGAGQAGTLTINASESVDLFGTSGAAEASEEPSAIFTATVGLRDAGSLTLTTDQLRIRDGATITASTAGLGVDTRSGTGRGGSITIEASESIEVTGRSSSGVLASNITSEAGRLFGTPNPSSAASGGTITLTTEQLIVQNDAEISTQTLGSGDAGNISIDAQRLAIQDGAQVSASASGTGSPGSISIENAGSVNLSDSTISTVVEPGAIVNNQTESSSDINIQTRQLSITNSDITASTFGQSNAGDITVRGANTINLNGGSISTAVNPGAIGQGGNINLSTNRLALDNRSTITSSTSGTGNTGRITITASDRTTLRGNSRITSEVQAGATGDSQQIAITTDNLSLRGESEVSVATNGNGSAGDIVIRSDGLSLGNSTISSEVQRNAIVPQSNANRSRNNDNDRRDHAIGSADHANRTRNTNDRQGNISIATESLRLHNGARISASTRGQGRAGNIAINDAQTVTLDDNSVLSTEVGRNGIGRGGNLTLDATILSLDDGQIRANTAGQGNAGNIRVRNADTVSVEQGRISTAVTGTSTGRGGSIAIDTGSFNLEDAQLTARTTGTRPAGNISVNATGDITATNSTIETSSQQSSGGNISLNANLVRLFDSDIQTDLESGTAFGGNIAIDADAVIAFGDSDIISAAPEGQGGDITLPVFFGEGYEADRSQQANPDELDNTQVDVNATGEAASGTITTPDTSAIQNSLSDLPTNAIDTDQLLANSCIVRTETGGTFLITGPGALPAAPGNDATSTYPTGEVRAIPESIESPTEEGWQLGEPIVEPQGVYQLPDGRLVMSRECQ